MEDTKFYLCSYCHHQYHPRRRRVQKYCSNSCRSKAYHMRITNTRNSTIDLPVEKPGNTNIQLVDEIKKMSIHGIADATAGSLAADALKSLLTHNDKKAATRGDLKKLIAEIKGRYHLVINLPPRFDGALPYFDFERSEIIYLF